MSKPQLIVNVGRKSLAMPLTTALWAAWRLATYPLTLLAAYYFYGTNGLLFVACILVLSNRGKI